MSSSQLADGQRGEAGHPLAEVEAADAARRLAVEAEGPERREPVGRQQGEEQHADQGSLSNATVQLAEQRKVVEASRRSRPRAPTPRAAPRRQRTRSRRRAAWTPCASSAGPRRVAAAPRVASLFEGPISHVSCIGNTFGKHKRRVALKGRGGLRQLAVPAVALEPSPLSRLARASRPQRRAYPGHGIAEPVDGMPAEPGAPLRGRPAYRMTVTGTMLSRSLPALATLLPAQARSPR